MRAGFFSDHGIDTKVLEARLGIARVRATRSPFTDDVEASLKFLQRHFEVDDKDLAWFGHRTIPMTVPSAELPTGCDGPSNTEGKPGLSDPGGRVQDREIALAQPRGQERLGSFILFGQELLERDDARLALLVRMLL